MRIGLVKIDNKKRTREDLTSEDKTSKDKAIFSMSVCFTKHEKYMSDDWYLGTPKSKLLSYSETN